MCYKRINLKRALRLHTGSGFFWNMYDNRRNWRVHYIYTTKISYSAFIRSRQMTEMGKGMMTFDYGFGEYRTICVKFVTEFFPHFILTKTVIIIFVLCMCVCVCMKLSRYRTKLKQFAIKYSRAKYLWIQGFGINWNNFISWNPSIWIASHLFVTHWVDLIDGICVGTSI